MCCLKEREGPEILQPAQGDNINKEGQTDTSVGGGEGEGWMGWTRTEGDIYSRKCILPDDGRGVERANNSLLAIF
jgi:hypothetical protein